MLVYIELDNLSFFLVVYMYIMINISSYSVIDKMYNVSISLFIIATVQMVLLLLLEWSKAVVFFLFFLVGDLMLNCSSSPLTQD